MQNQDVLSQMSDNPYPLPTQPSAGGAAGSGEPSGNNKKIIAAVVAVVAVLVLAGVGYYVWKTFSSSSTEEAAQNIPLQALAPVAPPSVNQPPAAPPASPSDDLSVIESELNDLNISDLEKEFGQDFTDISKEL